MKQNDLLLSIITINYNGLNDTCQMVDSLQKHLDAGNMEIIVVDNASNHDEASALEKRYSGIKVIRSPQNLGFAGGNNLGIRAAQGQYILLLNNDTYVKDNHLWQLTQYLENHPDTAAVSPLIVYAHDERTIQCAGFTPMSAVTLRNRSIGNGERNNGQFKKPIPTAFCHGAAMCIRKGVIDTIGLMPECYFLYYEEMDWCNTMRKAGYQLAVVPTCVVFHKESQTVGSQSATQTYYISRNRLLYASRQLQGLNKYLSYAYQIGIVSVRDTIRNLIKGQTSLIQATYQGIYSFIEKK